MTGGVQQLQSRDIVALAVPYSSRRAEACSTSESSISFPSTLMVNVFGCPLHTYTVSTMRLT
jgi:hypothetical protein